MRLAIDNYLDDSTITATSENASYPVDNLYHRFLEKHFKSNGSQSTITIELPEDRTVSMIALGFNNIVDSEDVYILDKTATNTLVLDKTATDTRFIQASTYYVLKNNSGTTLQTGELELGQDTVITYFEPLECRTIELVFASAPSETLYIGGISITDPLDIKYIQVNPNLNIQQRVTQRVTDGGQSIAKYRKDLENWATTIRGISNAKRKEIVAAIRATRKPVFVDLYPLNHDRYDPLYADITDWGTIRRDSENDLYDTAIGIEQRR